MVFYLTLNEVEGMLGVAEIVLNNAKTEKQTNKALRDIILMRILYWGYRVSEVVGDEHSGLPGIYYQHIDFKTGTIVVKQKGKDDLARIIDKETLNMIKLYCNLTKIKRGQILAMHRTTAWRILKRIARKAKLERADIISCHPFGRHTFAIHAVNRYHLFMKDGGRFDIKKVSKQLGHADIETTMKFYLPFVTEDLKEAAFGIA